MSLPLPTSRRSPWVGAPPAQPVPPRPRPLTVSAPLLPPTAGGGAHFFRLPRAAAATAVRPPARLAVWRGEGRPGRPPAAGRRVPRLQVLVAPGSPVLRLEVAFRADSQLSILWRPATALAAPWSPDP